MSVRINVTTILFPGKSLNATRSPISDPKRNAIIELENAI